MKKLFSFFGALFLGLLINYFNPLLSNSTGAPFGYTGSPADGQTCAVGGCHGGGSLSEQAGAITSSIPDDGYVPGTTYTLTLSIEESGSSRFGFQITAEDNAGNKVGGFQSNAEVQINTAATFATHRSANFSSPKVWTIDWVAPAAGTNNVTFYAAFNTGSNRIYTSNLTRKEVGTTGIAGGSNLLLSAFYSPLNKAIMLNNIHQKLNYGLFDIKGKTIQQGQILPSQTEIAMPATNPGIYLLHLSDIRGDVKMSRKLMIAY